MPADDILIQSQNMSLDLQGKLVLDNITLSLKTHDFITVIGPNGAGKSSLLKSMMGLIRPSSGSIWRKENLKIGYIPQRMMIDQTMPITVKRFLNLHNRYAKSDFERIINDTNIKDLLDKQLPHLSGGELQRVLLARALNQAPDLLILDEPAQNLDVAGQLQFYRLLDAIYNEHKCAIFMVSHDLHMVMASTRKVICLFHHICCHGEPHQVTKDPEFISLFGPDMAHMMAVYQHSHDHDHLHDHTHQA